MKWTSLSTRPSRTDRWLSARLNSYLSSRCLIRGDYTLLGKRVKHANSHIIGYPHKLEKKPCYPKCVIIKSLNQKTG
jgi:hypothetical protein